MFAVMTIGENYKQYMETLLSFHSKGEAMAIADMIFEHYFKLSKSAILQHTNMQVAAAKQVALQQALAELNRHVPAQHITGEAWFYNLKLAVSNAVLIPRPETEELVQQVIHFLKISPSKKILDIGTGSGCIPIAIKKNIPDAAITSIDVSAAALRIAIQNAKTHKADIQFMKLDFLKEQNWNLLDKFDVIVSNPPYIPENERSKLDKNVVLHEPHLALFVPENNALLFYKKIALFAQKKLLPAGKIFVETHQLFAEETKKIFTENNFEASILKDINGNNRMLTAVKQN